MAKLVPHSLLEGMSGTIGKRLVFKNYGGKTVVSKYPDMKGVPPSELQKEKRSLFREAVAYARAVNRSPGQKAMYATKVKKGESVYQYALKEYLAKHKK